jgi:hypothetical protein
MVLMIVFFLIPVCRRLVYIRLRVFNRWGGEVFALENEDLPLPPGKGWDGRIKERKAATGVYTWVMQVTFIDDRVERLGGVVNLLR